MSPVLVLLFLPAFVAPGEARTLYVDGMRGNDATSYAGNGASTPWRSIGRAAWGSGDRDRPDPGAAARAGDVVLVAAGVYSVAGTNSRNMPAYQPTNSGSAGSPIAFKADGPVTLTLSSGTGSVIGSFERHYIVWDGFTIHEAQAPSAPDTGPATIWLCNGCAFLNLDINGNGDAGARQDNHTGIRIEASSNILIRNNRIQNVQSAHNPNNGAGIMTYSSSGLLIEHNEISSSGSGIFLKGGGAAKQDYLTIRYNLVHHIGNAVGGNGIVLHVGAGSSPQRPTLVHQNIIHDVREAGIKIWMLDGLDPAKNPNNSRIVNNTIVTCGSGLWVTHNLMDAAGHVFRNNIVSGTDVAMLYEGAPSNLAKSRLDSEHNVFFKYLQFAVVESRVSLPDWRKTFRQDAKPPASVDRDPGFVNTAGFDFHLLPNSPSRKAGLDVLDLDGNGQENSISAGAYVTGTEVIGLER